MLTVRRLVRAKGLENLIDAVDAIRRRIPDVLVVIVGTGPLAADLRARVEARGVGERGSASPASSPRHDLPSAYRAADLMIVPTIALEGFGLVVVEALACGTPVLVTPIAGLPEVVRDLDPALILPGRRRRVARGRRRKRLDGGLAMPDARCVRRVRATVRLAAIATRVRAVYAEAR